MQILVANFSMRYTLLYLVALLCSQCVSKPSPLLPSSSSGDVLDDIVGENNFQNFPKNDVATIETLSTLAPVAAAVTTEKSSEKSNPIETTTEAGLGGLFTGEFNILKAVSGASAYIQKQASDLVNNFVKTVQKIPGIQGLTQALESEAKEASISNALLKVGEQVTEDKTTTTAKSTRRPKVTTAKQATNEEEEEEEQGGEVDSN